MKETDVKTLKSKYSDTSDIKLRKLADAFSLTGVMKNRGTKGTTSIVELHSGGDLMLVYIKHESISKSSHIEFNAMKEGTKVCVKGRLFKNIKDRLCLDATYIEKVK